MPPNQTLADMHPIVATSLSDHMYDQLFWENFEGL